MRHLGAVLLLTLLAGAAAAQEQEIRLPFEGPEVFCHILNRLEVQSIANSAEIGADPAESFVILFGNPRILSVPELWPMGLDEFIANGGNVLVATDHFLAALGVRITGSKIVQPGDKGYGGDPRCPVLAYGKADGGAAAPGHPIFLGLSKRIATNCPSHVRINFDNPTLTELLDYPDGTQRDPTAPPAPKLPFGGGPRGLGGFKAIAGSPKEKDASGRVLVIAGHGVFMNGMMLQTDNDNFEFAINVVRWLRQGPNDTTRKKALFIVDGVIIDNFAMNLAPPAPPLPVPTVTMLNRLIRGLEDERFFHRLLGDALGGNWNRLLSVLFGVITVLLVIYGAKKLLQGRTAPDTSPPSMVGAPVAFEAGVAAAKERNLAVARKANHAETARLLVHDWLLGEFGIAPTAWRGGLSAEFSVNGYLWSRWRLERQGSLVLDLASAAKPTRLSRREFFALITAIQDLSEALRDGRATLLIDGKVVRQS